MKRKHGTKKTSPRIAIAHDYLTQRGGAERVALSLHRAFPEAKIYTTLYDPASTFPEFKSADIVTSPLNALRIFRKNHRLALPLLAVASSLVKIDADVVVASSSGWAHGFKTKGVKLTYCHTPARWLYLKNEYLGPDASLTKRIVLKVVSPWLKTWDQNAAKNSGPYVANSTVVQQRIRSIYGKNAPIIFPPHSVNVEAEVASVSEIGSELFGKYLLVVSRLMPYKNVGVAIDAATLSGLPIVVVGRGPEKLRLEKEAGDRAIFLSDLSEEELRYVYSGARFLIAPSYEDFGITPLEAAAWGIPTLALRSGGYLDTVVDGVTGLFFEKPTASDISQSIDVGLNMGWNRKEIRDRARLFAEDRFISEINDQLEKLGFGNFR